MTLNTIQVNSIDTFTCQQFKQFFSEGKKRGVITTPNNGRKYNVVWDTSANAISVKRDLTNVDLSTRFSETVGRWLQFDFTSNAEKWENRLTVQKTNVKLAEPLGNRVNKLLIQLETTSTNIESGQYFSETVQNKVNDVTAPLTQLLEKKKQHLSKQGKGLAAALNQNLESSQVWTHEQKAKNSVEYLELQTQQFTSFVTLIQNVIGEYTETIHAIDASKYSLIFAAILNRLNSVAMIMQKMVNDYFNPDSKEGKKEITKQCDEMYEREKKIAFELNGPKFSTHFSNSLLPPFFEESGTQQQLRIKLDYQARHMIFMSNLIDVTKTWDDIKSANEALKEAAYQ